MNANLPKVVLSEHLDEQAAQWLSRRAELVRCSHEDAAGLERALAEARGLIVRTYTRVDERLLEVAPRLAVVGRAGVGLDNIDLDACRRRGIRVVHTPDANTQAVVEYVFSLVLDALRPRVVLDQPLRAEAFRGYRKQLVGRQMSELTLGVLGMGRIGRRIAHVARAMGAVVIANDIQPPHALGLTREDAAIFVDKPRLWAESDVLTFHVDGREQNRYLIDERVLSQLKATCLLVNTSRGMVVDPQALAGWARSLRSDEGGAILDVHDPEPPDEAYPLWGIPNVTLLPHLASRTHTAMRNMSSVVGDVVRVLEGEAPEHAAV